VQTFPVIASENQIPSYLQDLNDPQREAIQHFEGPLLILAGAGSGKTRVLTRRIAHLVLEHGVDPQAILAVTFTNKATEEMRERLHALLGDASDKLWVATFHSAGLRILRRHAKYLGYTNEFVVYDDQDTKGVVKGILKELGIDEKKWTPNMFLSFIDRAKNAMQLPEDIKPSKFDPSANYKLQVYTEYQRVLHKANAMDFGDLLLNAVLLFKRFPEVLRIYQHGLRFVLVDEFQDTNTVQYALMRMLTALHKNLLVVGDDDQSIYAFRGATIANILDFEKDFPNAKVVKLEQNYRSTGTILKAAHAVIEKNTQRKDKKLWTSSQDGAKIRAFVAEDEEREAHFIAKEISAIKNSGSKLREVAIFYRTNAQSRALEEAFLAQRIPYRIFGGLKFYDRKEIKDILGYLRILTNDLDNQAFMRVVNTPTRGIGPQKIQSLISVAKQHEVSLYGAAKILAAEGGALRAFVDLIEELRAQMATISLGELVKLVVEKTQYLSSAAAKNDPNAESRVENVHELEATALRFQHQGAAADENPVKAFLDRVVLTSGGDQATQGESNINNDAVAMMTLHLAKGLEFDHVFLTGVEEGLLPHYRSIDDPMAIEEERRLCYVGITRARKKL
jgi:DNA helicase II / ATP-dependent DNA helicase PcrA